MKSGKKEEIGSLIFNEDCTQFFVHDFPEGKAGGVLDGYVDVLAGTGVEVMMINTNARRTNYKSDVWQAWWEEDEEGTYALARNMLEVHRQGVDYPERIIRRCRFRGISPWISLRMNDCHSTDDLEHPFHTDFYRRSELWRAEGAAGGPYFERALDYTHPGVRGHYLALIIETLERYDIDGLELDFLREPYLFGKGGEGRGSEILNGWMREARGLADAAAKRRGRRIFLGVRVPSCPDTAAALGLDVRSWAAEGLVDLVTASPRWYSIEFDIPLARWRKIIGERVALAGGLEPAYRIPGVVDMPATAQQRRGAAVAVLSDEADALYLFNHFYGGPRHGSQWEEDRDSWRDFIKSLSSLELMLPRPRSHAVTGRDVFAPGAAQGKGLPAEGAELSFEMHLGPALQDGWSVKARVELETPGEEESLPELFFNGITGEFCGEMDAGCGRSLLAYCFPAGAVGGENRDAVKVSGASDGKIRLLRLEVDIVPEDVRG